MEWKIGALSNFVLHAHILRLSERVANSGTIVRCGGFYPCSNLRARNPITGFKDTAQAAAQYIRNIGADKLEEPQSLALGEAQKKAEHDARLCTVLSLYRQ
jgi:hypothetical protein